MCEVVNLLSDCRPILPHSLMSVGYCNDMHDSHMALQWLVKQVHVSLRSHTQMLMINSLLFEILKVVPNPNPEIVSMIQKLQDLINKSKEDAIIVSFKSLRHWQVKYYCPILSVWNGNPSHIDTFYSSISFLLSEGLSEKCHSSIIKYYLFILVTWISKLIDDWYLSLYF